MSAAPCLTAIRLEVSLLETIHMARPSIFCDYQTQIRRYGLSFLSRELLHDLLTADRLLLHVEVAGLISA
jgi:hypothetical protein